MRPFRALVFLSCFTATLVPHRPTQADDAPQPPLVVTKLLAEDQAIYEALRKRRAWKFAETPLSDVRAEFAKELAANIVFDATALEVAGVSPESTVTLDLRESSAKTALDLVCRELELDWMVREGVLILTTAEEVEQHVEPRVYDVAAICPPFDAEGIEQPFDPDSLIELITSVIEPTSWEATGGYGGMTDFELSVTRGLVIPQTARTHEQIEQLLSALARLRKSRERDVNPAKPVVSAASANVSRIFAALDIRKDWVQTNASLDEALSEIEAAIGIDVVLDPEAERLAGPFSTMSISLSDATARATMDARLLPDELTWTILDDLILVTSHEYADAHWQSNVYDVADFHEPRGDGDVDFDDLINLITSTIDPSSWTDVGGTGCIPEFESGRLKVLVIAQTPQNHAAIAKLLADLRALRAQTPAPPANANPAAATPLPEFGGGNPPSSAAPTPRDSGDITDRSRRFAVKLYRELAARGDGNVLVSPYSAFEALGMVYVGARGGTAQELAGALECTGIEPTSAAPMFGRLRRSLLAHARFGKNELRIANRLWGQRDYPFLPEYFQSINAQFASAPELVDFHDKIAVIERINEWSADQTAGRITDVVDSSDIDELTRFVLTNAVYFKADWAAPFLAQNTRRGVFKAPHGEPRVQYMNRRIRCQYAEHGDLQLASLPYNGDRYSMVFLLPRLGKTPQQLEATLTSEHVHAWLTSLRTCDVDLRIPKFQFETKIELNPILQSLGATSMFDPDKADLSGISANALADRLAINKIRQKTFIEVNEHGTEAAAVTTGFSFGGGFGPRQPVRVVKFHAERPFLFLIRDDETGVILFLGRVTNPEFPDDHSRRQ